MKPPKSSLQCYTFRNARMVYILILLIILGLESQQLLHLLQQGSSATAGLLTGPNTTHHPKSSSLCGVPLQAWTSDIPCPVCSKLDMGLCLPSQALGVHQLRILAIIWSLCIKMPILWSKQRLQESVLIFFLLKLFHKAQCTLLMLEKENNIKDCAALKQFPSDWGSSSAYSEATQILLKTLQ